MPLMLVLGLFVFVILISAFFVFSDARLCLVTTCLQAIRRMKEMLSNDPNKIGVIVRKVIRFANEKLVGLLQYYHGSRGVLAFFATVLFVPPLVAVALNVRRIPEYQDDARESDSKIVELLRGEQLAPPVSLPPEVFVTREVELVRPNLAEASRNWELLDEQFRQRLLYVFKIMRERYGYDMALLEGYRTPARQAELQAHGAGVVTNAGAYESFHQYGLASDCAFIRAGKLVISEKDPWAMRGYELYGQVAESLGLTWGGRWRLLDLGHVELRRAGVIGKRS